MICPYKEYKTINGQEKYEQINYQDFKVDLKKFIDPKSNKIKFKLNAVMKLLPYNGFYPQQRTTQVAGIFNKVYLDGSRLCTDAHRADSSSFGAEQSSGSQAIYNTLASTQPLFSPGILFNTIKSGIAVDWPTYITSSEDMIDNLIYKTGSYYSDIRYYIGNINYRLPFESLLNPTLFFRAACYSVSSDISTSIPYLDPTHVVFANYYNQYNTAKVHHITKEAIDIMDTTPFKNIYKSAINNFLYETVNFFLKDKKLNSFSSREINRDEQLPRDENICYSMDIIIKKNSNFSMFNQINYSGSNQFVPSASLFGPPCSSSYENNISYMPYTPPYFRENGESRVRISLPSGTINSSDPLVLMAYMILDGNTENISEVDIAQYNRMKLNSCMNFSLQDFKNNNSIVWHIQTKFETPLINFSKCSNIEVFESEYILKHYPSY